VLELEHIIDINQEKTKGKYMSRNNLQSYFIVESCTSVPNDCIQILENTTKNGVPKLIFKARLQTANEHNSNRRYYPQDICQEIVTTLAPKAKGRSLFQEVDHPVVSGDDVASKSRAVTVKLQNSGTLLRNIYMKGPDVIGEMETLTGFLGPDLYNLIVYDKADIGFSLRMFGKVEMEGDTGISRVSRPIRPITYDTVTNPSHKTARILSFLPENATEFVSNSKIDTSVIYESDLSIDNIHLPNVNESIYEYLDMLVLEHFSKLKPVRFNF